MAGRLPTRSTAGAPSLAEFEADKRSIRLSATFAGSRPDLLREAMTNMGAELRFRVYPTRLSWSNSSLRTLISRPSDRAPHCEVLLELGTTSRQACVFSVLGETPCPDGYYRRQPFESRRSFECTRKAPERISIRIRPTVGLLVGPRDFEVVAAFRMDRREHAVYRANARTRPQTLERAAPSSRLLQDQS